MKPLAPLHRESFGRLVAEVHRDRAALGRAAALACVTWLRTALAERGAARVVFEGTAAHDEFFAALAGLAPAAGPVAWPRVTVFQLADYEGLGPHALQGTCHYLRRHFLDHVPVAGFHLLDVTAADRDAACTRYAALLAAKPIDLICLGIGTDGRLAGNDPSAANFEDEQLVKRTALGLPSRQELVTAGGFASLPAVPRHALTLTLPVLRRARRLSVHVAGADRAQAVRAALHDAITTACPATMLRLHPAATLYLDSAAAALACAVPPARKRRPPCRP